MNKNGKSNILSIILFPVFLIIILIVVDTIISYSQNKFFKEATESIIETVLLNENLEEDDYFAEVKRLYENRGFDTEMLYVSYNYDRLLVENEYKYFGLISSLTSREREKGIVRFLGIDFNVRKGNKTFISVTGMLQNNGKVIFEYSN